MQCFTLAYFSRGPRVSASGSIAAVHTLNLSSCTLKAELYVLTDPHTLLLATLTWGTPLLFHRVKVSSSVYLAVSAKWHVSMVTRTKINLFSQFLYIHVWPRRPLYNNRLCHHICTYLPFLKSCYLSFLFVIETFDFWRFICLSSLKEKLKLSSACTILFSM